MRIIYLTSLLFLTYSCQPNVQDLKKKYSVEVINFFYETAFFEDGVGRREEIGKWNKDIYIYLPETFHYNDILNIKDVIAHIDSLRLPIKVYQTSDSTIANMFIYFGDYLYLKMKGFNNPRNPDAMGSIKNNFESAIVGIPSNAGIYKRINKTDSIKFRQVALLEEITQCLGITGDSWHYPNSIFFEGGFYISNFTSINKDVIKFLYEPSIPVQYSRRQFEKDFGDVLHHINAPKKIADYVLTNNIKPQYLEYIREKCFTNDTLIKWPTEVYIRLTGDVSQEDSIFCENTIRQLNSVNNQLRFAFTNEAYRVPVINISYISSDRSNVTYGGWPLRIGRMMFPRRGAYEIFIAGNTENYQETRNSIILTVLYEYLGFNYSNFNKNVVEIDSLGNISLKPDYKEILSLIYEPVFYSGLTIKEFDEAIEIIEKKGYFSQYSRQQFEHDFEYHHTNAPQKIVDYVITNNIPFHYLEYIREKCFNNRELVKWQSKIYVRLNGDVSQEDSVFCQSAVSLLNSVSDRFHLTFTSDTLKFPVIDMNYRHNGTVGHYKRAMQTFNIMFPARKAFEINVKDSIQEKRNGIIFDSLYESLGFNNEDITEGISKFDSSGNISFNPDYKEILALIYEPVFYSGLTIKEFDEAMEILKAKHSN